MGGGGSKSFLETYVKKYFSSSCCHHIFTFIMDYAPKSMSAGSTTNVDINSEMDEVLKRIQVR